MRSFSAIFLALVFGLTSARAQWTVESAQSEWSSGHVVEHRHVSLRNGSASATLELAIFSPKNATLRVIDEPDANQSLGDIMQSGGCIAGTNGGYFDPEYKPVGLLLSDGKTVSPLVKAKLLSGVVSVANGRVQIQRPAAFSLKGKPTAARQCGPFLVEGGKPIVGLNNARTARRTFVATTADDLVIIGYSSPLTLAGLGDLLATSVFKVQRALNMDGGSSSGFWFAGEKEVTYRRELKTVRDYLGIVPR